MRIWYNNSVFKSTITASSENLNLPADNLKKFQTVATFRTVLKTSQWLKFDGSAKADSVWILNHNLTSLATVKIQGSNYSDFSYVQFEQELTIDDYVYGGFTEQTFLYWRITFDDPTNTANYLEVGYVFIGCYQQMPAMKPDQQFVINTTAKYQTGDANVSYSAKGVQFRSDKINLVGLDFDGKKAVKSMFESVGNYQPVIMVVWEDDFQKEEPCYCILDGKKLTFKTSKVYGREFDTSFNFREVL